MAIVRRLATGLTNLGRVQARAGDPAAHDTLTEAIALAGSLGDWRVEALARLNLGVMYMTLSRPPAFDLADSEFAKGYDLTVGRDPAFTGEFLTERGTVHYERALVEPAGGERRAELERAAELMERAAELRPTDAVLSHQLGQVLRRLGNIEGARAHLEHSIGLREAGGDLFHAAESRLHLAQALEDAGLREEALRFAEAASQQLAQAQTAHEELELEAEATVARLTLAVRGG